MRTGTDPGVGPAHGVYLARLGGFVIARGRRVPRTERLRELWHFRHMLRHLVARNLKVKYKRSALGFLWTLLHPAATIVVLVAVFSTVVRLPIPHYWAFLLSGWFAWNTASQAIFSASTILTEHARLTRSVAFPKEILVLAALAARLVELAIELALAVVILVALHHGTPPPACLLLPVLFAAQALLLLGLMLPLAVLSTLFRDVTQGLPVFLTTLFYLSPVFYPATMVPEGLRALYFVNPFAALLTCFQRVLYDGAAPPPPLLGLALGTALVVLFAGAHVFSRYEEICGEIV
jgi:ABC-type polysaccharide/polyol phosphate export permease